MRVMDPSYDPTDVGGMLLHALFLFLPVLGVAGAFGLVLWIVMKRRTARETAKRVAWLADRRAKRTTDGGPEARSEPVGESRMERNQPSDR
jgi:hypothetical protein